MSAAALQRPATMQPGGAISSSKRCPAALLVTHTAPDVSHHLVDRLAEQMNLRAISLGGHQLWERDVDQHEHRRRDPKLGRSRRNALRMVAALAATTPRTRSSLFRLAIRLEAPRGLERPHALEALALEPYVFAGAIREHPRRDDRG